MLHFVFLARVVVGRLECDDRFGESDGIYFVVDKTKCRVGDMNAAFNEGEELMSGCRSDGWVRWRYHVLPLPFG